MMRNKRSWVAALTLSLAGCGGADSPPDTSLTPEQPRSEQQRVSSLALPIERVPLQLHRRAAQLLEDVRGSESAPTWAAAVLAPTVQPLYRPDVTGVAYYEFRVLARGVPMGFIIVSTGGHDFPIAHWDFEGLSPTETLLQQGGTAITAFYKVDSLTYVAEGSRGELLASLGDLPSRIIGQDPSWLDLTIPSTDVTWKPAVPLPDDSQAGGAVFRQEVVGPKLFTRPPQLASWSSWQELKAYYHASYGTLAASLRRQAAGEWRTDTSARETGEGLVIGRPLELALVYPQATVSLGGEGAGMVRSGLVTTPAGTQKLVLTAVAARRGAALPLTVGLRYANGVSETVRVVVLAPEDVVPLPETQATDAKGEGVAWADMEKLAWNSTEFWAGTKDDQRLYGQISPGVWPNNGSCKSGCGATAWAMLFGWADFQASLNHPTWKMHWGLYRLFGGTSPTDAVAPKNMDVGVHAMTWELAGHIATWCDPFSTNGATFPWDMDQAYRYLEGRSMASLSTHYNVLGIHEERLFKKARHSIKTRHVPAIIGTGWLEHYPLAFGYRWRTLIVEIASGVYAEVGFQNHFYVNKGWRGAKNGWITPGTWFVGQLWETPVPY